MKPYIEFVIKVYEKQWSLVKKKKLTEILEIIHDYS